MALSFGGDFLKSVTGVKIMWKWVINTDVYIMHSSFLWMCVWQAWEAPKGHRAARPTTEPRESGSATAWYPIEVGHNIRFLLFFSSFKNMPGPTKTIRKNPGAGHFHYVGPDNLFLFYITTFFRFFLFVCFFLCIRMVPFGSFMASWDG